MAIYTYDEAERIIEVFDDILCQYNIFVPSPEDTDEFNNKVVGFHGSIYKDLLNKVEENLVDVLKRHKTDTDVIINQFSETNEIVDDDMSNLIKLLKQQFKHNDEDDIFVSTNESHRYTVYTENNKITAFSIEYFKNNNKVSNTDTSLMKKIVQKYFNCYHGTCIRLFDTFQSTISLIVDNDVIYDAAIQRGIKDIDMDIIYMPVGLNKYIELIYNDNMLTEINVTNTPMKDIYTCGKNYSLDSNTCVAAILAEIISHEGV